MPEPVSATHRQCRNLAPLDVVKGICQRTHQRVLVDDPGCDRVEELPRCGLCGRYAPADQPELGWCEAAPGRPLTYPDLTAVTCEQFARRGERP